MRVMVTGAAGFIGSNVARLLLQEGHEVAAIVSPTTDTWRLTGIYNDLYIVYADLPLSDRVVKQIQPWEPEVCLHLAWRGWPNDVWNNLASLEMSAHLLKTLPLLACPRVVLAGSCFEYDLTRLSPVSETSPQRPHEVYGAVKQALYALHPFCKLSVAHARIFSVYGPFEDPRRLVPSVVQSLLLGEKVQTTHGTQVRDYLHVKDVASALWAIAQSDTQGAVNVGSGTSTTVKDIAVALGHVAGKSHLVQVGALPYRQNEPLHVVADVRKLQGLGWSAQYQLIEGLCQTFEWWQTVGVKS